ncbi:MAG TPA: 30S ribosomal protein S8, partial [Opitutaceae bacterium]|nr:30S ribosomal protein S8 [Opitutaceae bacterium]
EDCMAPYSRLKERLAAILKAEGYIADHATGANELGHKTLIVKLKYVDSAPALTGIRRMSTPGRRLYCRSGEIPLVLNGLGISILSTSKGLLKDQDCRRNKLGGELLCNVW